MATRAMLVVMALLMALADHSPPFIYQNKRPVDWQTGRLAGRDRQATRPTNYAKCSEGNAAYIACRHSSVWRDFVVIRSPTGFRLALDSGWWRVLYINSYIFMFYCLNVTRRYLCMCV